MKRLINSIKEKNCMGILNCMALSMVVLSAQTFCFWFWHQPDFPEEADKYRKFK